MENVLEVRDLRKEYDGFTAVDGISFSMGRGQIIGLLGPNGAGKSTTIQVLLGITLSNGGAIRYFSKDFVAHRLESLARVNSASAFNTLLGRITVRENLLVFADLYRIPDTKQKISRLLDRFEIAHLASSLYQNLSAGQKTRVNLVKSLLNDPEILLMDEPTASLDPDIADKTLTLIEEMKHERSLSILYTSHNMNEVTRLCDEVIFLDHGRIVAHDTPLNLTKRISAATLCITTSNGKEHVETILRKRNLRFSFSSENRVEISSDESHIPDILVELKHAGISIIDIEIRKPTLEDVFLQIARKSI